MGVRRWAATGLVAVTVVGMTAAMAAAAPVDPGSAPAGTVVDWGSGAGVYPSPAGLRNIVQIAASDNYALALSSAGTITGWGSDREASPPAGLNDVVEISAAMWRGAALRRDGSVVTWGTYAGDDALLGQDNIAVAAGTGFTVVLKRDRTVRAEGANVVGQTDVPPGLRNVRAIATGGYRGTSATPCGFALALKDDGTVVVWGASGTYLVSCGEDFGAVTRVPAGLSDVIAISGGSDYALALKSDGTVVAWGRPSSSITSVPAYVRDVVSISAGMGPALAVRADGSVAQWGGDEPTVPPNLGPVTAVAGGRTHLVALSVATPVGSPVLQTRTDENPAGTAEAFRFTATTTGSIDTLSLFIDPSSKASQLQLGLYSATSAGEPGALIAASSVQPPFSDIWMNVRIPTTTVTSGKTYWLALLGPKSSGKLRFRDRADGTGNPTRTSAQTNLTELPASWRTGRSFTNGPASFFVR